MSAEGLAWAFKHSPYKGTKKLIHVAIGDVVNDAHDNRFWMSNATLAEKCSCDRAYVNAVLKEMVEDGFLEVVTPSTGRGKTVEYRFLFPESVEYANTFPSESVNSDEESVDFDDTLGAESVDFLDESVMRVNTNSNNSSSTTTQDNSTTPRDRVWQAYLDSIASFRGGGRLPVFSNSRKALIDKRLKEYSVEDLLLAVTGWVKSPFHTGDNPTGKIYNSIELILRNSEKVEQFIDYHQASAPVAADSNAAWGQAPAPTKARKVLT